MDYFILAKMKFKMTSLPVDKAVGRGIVSYVGQNAGMVRRIGGRAAGGSIGMLIGGAIGSAVPGQGLLQVRKLVELLETYMRVVKQRKH